MGSGMTDEVGNFVRRVEVEGLKAHSEKTSEVAGPVGNTGAAGVDASEGNASAGMLLEGIRPILCLDAAAAGCKILVSHLMIRHKEK
jgi:hypothetical protein